MNINQYLNFKKGRSPMIMRLSKIKVFGIPRWVDHPASPTYTSLHAHYTKS